MASERAQHTQHADDDWTRTTSASNKTRTARNRRRFDRVAVEEQLGDLLAVNVRGVFEFNGCTCEECDAGVGL
jgi:hypothetical protein